MIPYCDTPWQSVGAAVTGGLVGGGGGLALGLDPVVVVALAGALGGAADLGAHLVRRDAQFEATIREVRAER